MTFFAGSKYAYEKWIDCWNMYDYDKKNNIEIPPEGSEFLYYNYTNEEKEIIHTFIWKTPEKKYLRYEFCKNPHEINLKGVEITNKSYFVKCVEEFNYDNL